MEIDAAIANFANTARRFCEWAEGIAGAPETEAHIARKYLAQLYAQALELPVSACWEGDAPEVAHARWRKVFDRFCALPVNYYGKSLDPLAVDASDTSLGDLADDLADVWRDLRSGLEVFDSGEVEGAAGEWREGFTIHWGLHATSAMFILQCWIQRNRSFDVG